MAVCWCVISSQVIKGRKLNSVKIYNWGNRYLLFPKKYLICCLKILIEFGKLNTVVEAFTLGELDNLKLGFSHVGNFGTKYTIFFDYNADFLVTDGR